MAWLFVIIIALLMSLFVYCAVKTSNTVGGVIAGISIFLIFSVLFSGMITCVCITVASWYADIDNNSVTETYEINRAIILDDSFVIETIDGETLEIPRNKCRVEIVTTDVYPQYVEFYENCKWESPVRQFLYGNATNYYKFYLNN